MKRFSKAAWIRSHHLYLEWKFKLLAGKFAWGVKAKLAGHCQQTFENKKFVDITRQCFASLPEVNFPTNNLNFQIQVIFLNLFYLSLNYDFYLFSVRTETKKGPCALKKWIHLRFCQMHDLLVWRFKISSDEPELDFSGSSRAELWRFRAEPSRAGALQFSSWNRAEIFFCQEKVYSRS